MKWTMRYESLVSWATREWEKLQPEVKVEVLWASDACGNLLAQSRVQKGRKLNGKAVYLGARSIPCPEVTKISEYIIPHQKPVLGESVGAYIFEFKDQQGQDFQVLYVSSYYRDDDPNIIAIALVAPEKLAIWAAFEQLCTDAARRPSRRQDVYIIGGTNTHFKPTVEWDDVVLPDDLKNDLRLDMESFFKDGVPIYKELNLAPFRKLLLVGPPGTGKTMLCAAMAKLALKKKRVVVYVSGADDDGASFHKIHHALNVVAGAGYPVLLIVEEIDVYLRKEDKARILNVLDGLESPNNPKGALLLATTNYPEVIDERIAKRPGRLDRIFTVPPVATSELAGAMLRRYMGPQWQEAHQEIAEKLVNQTGAFVREVALHARMLAAHHQQRLVSLEMLEQSLEDLSDQMTTDHTMMPRRDLGFTPKRNGRRAGLVPAVATPEGYE
jgi:energy-coupling factor transporter ATP-binding protein EcfA2